MSRSLLDISTVLALLDPQHEHHPAALAWAERRSDARWLTCPLVQNGVVRIASQHAYSRRLGDLTAVHAALRAFCAQPRHEFCPDDISILDQRRIARPGLLTPNAITDAYLLALARHHGARFATCDRRISTSAVDGAAEVLELIGP